MSQSEEAKNSSKESHEISQNNEFETPQRKRKKFEENKSDSGNNENQEHPQHDFKLISDSKTEPVMHKKDDMMIDEEFQNAKQYFTSKKVKKTLKLSHLNSLSAIIGEIGGDIEPQIIFHSPN